MRNKILFAQIKVGQFLKKCRTVILDRSGEGFVDTAVFCVED